MDDKKIEGLIWRNESSVNNRLDIIPNKIIDNDNNEDWNSIKFLFQIEAKNLADDL